MGMSASQARLLTLTARMHDIEYQAQELENTKLSLSRSSETAYDDYCEQINRSKYQMKVVTSGSTDKVDVTYNALVTQSNNSSHDMYVLTDTKTNNIYLPEAVTKSFNNGSIPSTLNEFLELVGRNYLYSDSSTNPKFSSDKIMSKMESDGNKSYWTAVYYQLTGYTDNDGNISNGHGYESVSGSNASDRNWIKKQIEEGKVLLNKMQSTEEIVGTTSVNIFAQTSVTTDTNLSETADTELASRAEVKYEHAMDEINQKDKSLDVQLSRLENERNALKTEYQTVQDLVKKNIERSYKTFNA